MHLESESKVSDRDNKAQTFYFVKTRKHNIMARASFKGIEAIVLQCM